MTKKRISLVLLLLSLCSSSMFGAIDAQYGFEGGVPGFIKVEGQGSLESSTDRFKDGSRSLKYSWSEPSSLVFSNIFDLDASFKAQDSGIIIWIYNPTPMQEGTLKFTFVDYSGREICHFDFGVDYQGWRTAWVKYGDMSTPDGGTYGDVPPSERNKNIAKMVLSTPEGYPQGTIYIDRLTFSTVRLHDQITPDQQIPTNNNHLHRNMWHWARLWEWEQYPALSIEPISTEGEQMLSMVEERLDQAVLKGAPSAPYTHNTLLGRADDLYAKYGINRESDGSIMGAPLLSDDEFNNSKGEMRIAYIQNIMWYYALDYAYTGNTSNIDKVINAFDHAIDQGFAYGSGQGTNHHYGYQVRDIYKAVWILRHELQKRGRLEQYTRVLRYWSGVAEARLPYQYGRDELLDSWHTLNDAKVISLMLGDDPAEKYTYMKALGTWLSGSLEYTPGTIGGLKVDGTSFHHGGFYPAYSVGAFAAIGNYAFLTKDTDFCIDARARECLKHALLTLRTYCNTLDWGVGVCGRHPFNGSIPKADVDAFGYLALLGDQTGSGLAADPQLGGAYLALGGSDKYISSELKKSGIKAASAPDGFYVYNYGAYGVHRRDGWMLSLKAYNTDVWSSEIYAHDNRYGRYQSYGTAQFIGSGKPISAAESGYSGEGWDWNRMPGATTIHLPFDKLNSPNKGTLMVRNSSRFPGVSSLEGRNGCMAFTYVEQDRPTFCAGATATKSVFCFDNRIVYLGSGISNDSEYPTETTLYQLELKSPDEEVEFGEDYASDFPYRKRISEHTQAILTDTKGNAYIVPDAEGLTLIKDHQKSPTDTQKKIGEGDFITAFINHGIAPKDAGYEYLMVIAPKGKEISKYSKKSPYTVLSRTNALHAVRDDITGICAYIAYGAYQSSTNGEVIAIDPETILMYRPLEDPKQKVLSICTPDLGLTEKTYTTSQPSAPLTRSVTLKGEYTLVSGEGIELRVEGGNTTLSAKCLNGQPVEIIIKLNK